MWNFIASGWRIMNYNSLDAAQVTGYPQGGYHGHLGTTAEVGR